MKNSLKIALIVCVIVLLAVVAVSPVGAAVPATYSFDGSDGFPANPGASYGPDANGITFTFPSVNWIAQSNLGGTCMGLVLAGPPGEGFTVALPGGMYDNVSVTPCGGNESHTCAPVACGTGYITSVTFTTAGFISLDVLSFTGPVSSGGSSASAAPVCDTRINCFLGTMVPIYCQEDAVEIWSIDPTGVGTLAIRVPYGDLLLLPEFPAENMTIATHDDIGFYKLSTGELQVNRGPDFEGKVYVFIWNGCPISNGYIRSFNIFDLFVQSTP